MTTAVILIALAAVVLGREWFLEQARRLAESEAIARLDRRHVVAAGLLVAAAVSWLASGERTDGKPEPTPVPYQGPIVLAGKFVGPQAAADAATLAALCDALADGVEYDAMKPEPRLTTGAAMDDLRVYAADGRMKGELVGERHPLVRQAIADYMAGSLGTKGGPLAPGDREKWAVAFREIARAAEAAIK